LATGGQAAARRARLFEDARGATLAIGGLIRAPTEIAAAVGGGADTLGDGSVREPQAASDTAKRRAAAIGDCNRLSVFGGMSRDHNRHYLNGG
jgi:hypothetical protein